MSGSAIISAGPGTLAAVQAAGLDSVDGLPHRRMEAWKYTDLRTQLGSMPPPAVAAVTLPEGDLAGPFAALAPRVVPLLNGRLMHAPGELLPCVNLSESPRAAPEAAVSRSGPMASRAWASAAGGLTLAAAAGAAPAEPVLLAWTESGEGPQTVTTRNAVTLGDGARLVLIERHDGPGPAGSLANHALDIALGAGARLLHVRVLGPGAAATHVQSLAVHLEQGAVYQLAALNLGGTYSRLELHAALAGDGAHVGVTALALLAGRDHGDVTTVLTHAVPGTTADQVVNSVLAGRARGVYQGRVVVTPGALATDSHQLAKAILLSETAEADTKPELEIFADDVKCGHGATVGSLDDDALFYLRARAIPEAEARRMLVAAFLDAALERVGEPGLQAALGGALAARLATMEAL